VAGTTAGVGAPGSAQRAPLPQRLLAYQAERFPLAGFVPLITLFTVASAAFSRIARHAPGTVSVTLLVVGSFTSLVCFFLLRVLDEHKDAEDDRRFRPELPVPRGLVTLAELRAVGTVAGASALLLNALLAPVMLLPLALVAAWATLMTREFFVRDWLRAHASAYLVTHMAIMPLIDGYTTGLDWLPAGRHPPVGVLWFLAVTFANGVLIEIGRKLRAPADERIGVDTYTHVWGPRLAPSIWLCALAASTWLSLRAAHHVGWPGGARVVFVSFAVAAAVPALWFVRSQNRAAARAVEHVSQAWPALTYLSLGVLPLLARALGMAGGR
jgi:4-hydroxybenzoate polyprenyltransferase